MPPKSCQTVSAGIESHHSNPHPGSEFPPLLHSAFLVSGFMEVRKKISSEIPKHKRLWRCGRIRPRKKGVWFGKNADVSEMMERAPLRPTYLKMIGTHIKTEVLRKTLEDSFWDSDHWRSKNSEKSNFSKVLLDCRGLEIERFFPKAEIRFPQKARFFFHRTWKESRKSRINGTKTWK